MTAFSFTPPRVVTAGPTIFMVKQDIATAVNVTEPGPVISSSTVVREDKTSVGFNLGADLNYFFMKRIGAGVLARYTFGSVDLDAADDSLGLGGFEIGIGLRLRY